MQSLALLPKYLYLCVNGEASRIVATGHEGVADTVSTEEASTVTQDVLFTEVLGLEGMQALFRSLQNCSP